MSRIEQEFHRLLEEGTTRRPPKIREGVSPITGLPRSVEVNGMPRTFFVVVDPRGHYAHGFNPHDGDEGVDGLIWHCDLAGFVNICKGGEGVSSWHWTDFIVGIYGSEGPARKKAKQLYDAWVKEYDATTGGGRH